MTTLETGSETLRQQAVARLRKRSDFWQHLAAYLLINLTIVVVWVAVADGGFFWPLFPLLGWGIGVFFHGMDVFRRPPSEERIRREMERLQ